ncbi:hypothetical protein [Streptomyces sp. NPDC004376]
MTAACLTEPTAETASDSTERAEGVHPRTRPLAALLDVQVVEVPGTVDAFQHFFGDV